MSRLCCPGRVGEGSPSRTGEGCGTPRQLCLQRGDAFSIPARRPGAALRLPGWPSGDTRHPSIPAGCGRGTRSSSMRRWPPLLG